MTVGLCAPPAVRPTRIAGLGAAVPDTIVSGAELVAPFGRDAAWLAARTGIGALRRLRPGEQLADLAVAAGRQALADAATDAAEVDTVIVATCSAPAGGPLSARVVAALAPHAGAFDVNCACAGFCYALSTAHGLVSSGAARTVLLIGAEQMSRLVDPTDLATSILFGDGAGAAVITADHRPGPRGAIAPAAWASFGARADVLVSDPRTDRLRMDGRAVFRWALDEVPAVASAALARAGVTPADVAVFVPHQANLRIVEGVAERLGLSHAVVARDVTGSGNTSAASIPLAVAALRAEGLVRGGELALLVGYGAGLGIAAQVVELP